MYVFYRPGDCAHVSQLARKYHPDTNADKGARDKFVEIQEAYDVRASFLRRYNTRLTLQHYRS